MALGTAKRRRGRVRKQRRRRAAKVTVPLEGPYKHVRGSGICRWAYQVRSWYPSPNSHGRGEPICWMAGAACNEGNW